MNRRYAMGCIILLLFTLSLTLSSSSEEITIVTWNARELFSIEHVDRRADDLRAFARDIQPDLLLLQEVISLDVVKRVRDVMGLRGYYIACSDFDPSDRPHPSAFEVAIISRSPLTQVIEYDPFPDERRPGMGDPPELPLLPLLKIGIEPINVGRGFLWAWIDEWQMTVYVAHLKSSLGLVGLEDAPNARKRELVAAAMAKGVLKDKRFFPDHAHVVAGDFNVGHSDSAKDGVDLFNNCYEDCGDGEDRYDATHALLREGLVGGLRMTNLTESITTSTFPTFPGTPIDNIYVAGPRRDRFSPAHKPENDETYGSDHTPVWTQYNLN